MKKTEHETITTERRFYPRFLVRWPVQVLIRNSSGSTGFEAETHDLSINGASISCSRELVDQLTVVKVPFPECHLHIITPDDSGIIKILCRLIISRRLSQDTYQLGFKALHFEGSSKILLDQNLSILESKTL